MAVTRKDRSASVRYVRPDSPQPTRSRSVSVGSFGDTRRKLSFDSVVEVAQLDLKTKQKLVVEVVPNISPAPQQTAAQAAEQERLKQQAAAVKIQQAARSHVARRKHTEHRAARDRFIDSVIDDVLAQQIAEPQATSVEDYRFNSSDVDLDKALDRALQGANKKPDQAKLRYYAERVVDRLNPRQETILFNMARRQGYDCKAEGLVKAKYFVHVVTQALPEDKQVELAKARPATEAKIAAKQAQHLKTCFGLPATAPKPAVEVKTVAKPQPTVAEQVQPVTFRGVIMANYNAEQAAQRRTVFAGLFRYNNTAEADDWSIDEIINHAAQGGHRTARAIEKSFDNREDKQYVREKLALIKKYRKTRPYMADAARRAIKNAFAEQQQSLASQHQVSPAL